MIGAPSRLRLIRKAAALARILETRDLSIEEKAAARKNTTLGKKRNVAFPRKQLALYPQNVLQDRMRTENN